MFLGQLSGGVAMMPVIRVNLFHARLRFHEGPLRQEDGRQGFQPGAACQRDWAVRRADSLAEGEAPVGARDALDPTFVAVGQSDLSKARINVDKGAPARAFVFLAPIP